MKIYEFFNYLCVPYFERKVKFIMNNLVDVVIPVYKPDKKLDRLICRLLKQSILPNKIILMHTVVNGLEGELEERFGHLEKIKIVPLNKEEFDHGETRNQGASLSHTPYILFLTQDAIPATPFLIERMKDDFVDPLVGAVYGRQLAGDRAGIVEQYTRMFNYPDQSRKKSKEDLPQLGIKAFYCSNVCCMYRRDIFEELGGFVSKTIFNEDMIFAYHILDAGYKIYYEAKAKVLHFHQYTYKQQFQRNFDLAVSQKQHEEIFSQVKSESEGIRLVADTMKYLIRERKYIWIFDLLCQSFCKYSGYKLGYQYKRLPKRVILKCTMNPQYWAK